MPLRVHCSSPSDSDAISLAQAWDEQIEPLRKGRDDPALGRLQPRAALTYRKSDSQSPAIRQDISPVP
jgi:hypothetical protein